MNPSQANPTGRFTGLAGLYARCRPGYPDEALDFIQDRCRLGPGSVLVDVGCGTGISSRLFAARGLRVVGIEPNAEMRAKAEAEPLPELAYRDGRAEATGLPDAFADAVLVAQAFHWFEPAAALAEFHRILRPGGAAALLGNERDESDPCTAAYGDVLRSGPGAAELERQRAQAPEAIRHSPHFTAALVGTFAYAQELDEEGLLGRAFSASYAPRRDEPAAGPFAEALRQVFARYQHQGRVLLRYTTTVYVGQRASEVREQVLEV